MYIPGKMVECMKVSIRRIRNMVMEFTLGLIRNAMQVGGLMVNNMVLEYSYQRKAKRNLDSGKMARKLNGSIKMK